MDSWCGTTPLRHSFPILFDLAVNKLETVADVWDQTVGNDSWKLYLSRDFKSSMTGKWFWSWPFSTPYTKKGSPLTQTRSLGRAKQVVDFLLVMPAKC